MRYWTTARRTIYLYASENVVFYRGLIPSTAIVSCELVPGQTQVLPYEPRHLERRLSVSGVLAVIPSLLSGQALSAAKDLCVRRARPFAEFTLSEAKGLRVTGSSSKCLSPASFFHLPQGRMDQERERRHQIQCSHDHQGHLQPCPCNHVSTHPCAEWNTHQDSCACCAKDSRTHLGWKSLLHHGIDQWIDGGESQPGDDMQHKERW